MQLSTTERIRKRANPLTVAGASELASKQASGNSPRISSESTNPTCVSCCRQAGWALRRCGPTCYYRDDAPGKFTLRKRRNGLPTQTEGVTGGWVKFYFSIRVPSSWHVALSTIHRTPVFDTKAIQANSTEVNLLLELYLV